MSEFDFGAEFASFGDDIKGTSYEGEYEMLVKDMKPGTSAKGKQMFTVTLAFQGGPLGAKNKTLDDRHYWSPENETAAKIFAATLRTLGAPQEWILSERPTPQQIADRCKGNVVSVRLKPDEFNGQPTTRVSYIKLVSASGGSPATAKSKAAAAVSLDDEDDTPAPAAAEAKEPVGVAAGTSEDPWAEG